jgi:hypothetical protein
VLGVAVRKHQHPFVSDGQIGILGAAPIAGVDERAASDAVGDAAGTTGGHGAAPVRAVRNTGLKPVGLRGGEC